MFVAPIGDFQLSRVLESEKPFLEAVAFLPDYDQAVADAHRDWLFPRYMEPESNKIILAIQSYIIKSPRHTILVDTCVGNHKPRPGRPMFHMLDTPYMVELAAAGVQPEEVDYVMCTHLHVDHVGWNTRLLDGRWVPTFPNAKYIFARREFEFWEERHRSGSEGKVPNVYADSVLPVVEAGQAMLVDSDFALDDGLWFEPAPGHTVGNIVINLQSGDRRATLTGDVIHHPLQLIRPEWSSRACEDPIQSAATRQALLERLVDTDILVAPAHFSSPTCGHIHHHGDGFRIRHLE